MSGNYVLNYLATRPKLEHYVTQGLVVLFAKITKLGWFDQVDDNKFAFREPVADVSAFLQVKLYITTLHLLLIITLTLQITWSIYQVEISKINCI